MKILESQAHQLAAAILEGWANGFDGMADAPFHPTHRHLKRGTEYEIVGSADLQVATDIMGDTTILLYRDAYGKLWARQEDEFHDGRFVGIAALQDAPK